MKIVFILHTFVDKLSLTSLQLSLSSEILAKLFFLETLQIVFITRPMSQVFSLHSCFVVRGLENNIRGQASYFQWLGPN